MSCATLPCRRSRAAIASSLSRRCSAASAVNMRRKEKARNAVKDHASADKANGKSADSPPQFLSAAGNEAMALAPPAYGIEFVDNGIPATAPSPIQRLVAPEPGKEAQEEKKKIGQAKFASAPSAMPQQESQALEDKTGMPDRLRVSIEALSGVDLADVRVHTNST